MLSILFSHRWNTAMLNCFPPTFNRHACPTIIVTFIRKFLEKHESRYSQKSIQPFFRKFIEKHKITFKTVKTFKIQSLFSYSLDVHCKHCEGNNKELHLPLFWGRLSGLFLFTFSSLTHLIYYHFLLLLYQMSAPVIGQLTSARFTVEKT